MSNAVHPTPTNPTAVKHTETTPRAHTHGHHGYSNYKKQTKLFAAVDVGMSKNSNRGVMGKIMDFTLDPQGTFHTVWDAFVLVLVIFSAIWAPYSLAFSNSPKQDWENVIDFIFVLDMGIMFFTAYDTGYKLEKDKKLIAIRYLKGWFLIDFLSTVDFSSIIGFFQEDLAGSTMDPNTKAVLKILRLMKMARLLRVSRLISRLTMNLNTNSTFIESGKFLLYVVIVAHLLACLFFAIPNYAGDADTTSWREGAGVNEMPDNEAYVVCLYWAFTTMTTIGYGDLAPVSLYEVIFGIFAEVSGLAVFALLVNQVNTVSEVFGMEQRQHNQWKDDVIGFIKQAGIEATHKTPLIEKVRNFLHFKSKSHFHSFTDDDPRFEVLSYALRDEIRMHIFLPALQGIKMFKDDEERERMEALIERRFAAAQVLLDFQWTMKIQR